MLNLPDFNRLKVFYIVYTNRSLVKASQILNITRAAVSQSLKALEEEMEIRLFIRDSKKVLPTEAAEALFKSLDPFMSDLQATLQEIETGKKEPAGHLRVGAPLDFGSTHLTEVISKFRQKYPRITFELTLAIPVKQLSLLTDGKLDLAFIDNADIHAKDFPVSILTVMKEKFVLACSKKYFDAHLSEGIGFEQIKNQSFVDYVNHAPVVTMWMKHHFKKVPSEIRVVFSAESVRAVINAINSGMGLGVVPEHLIREEIRSGKIRVIRAQGRELINQIAMTRRLDRPVPARERVFSEFYKSYIRN